MGLFARNTTGVTAHPPWPEQRRIWRDTLGRGATRCLQVLLVLGVVTVVILAITQLSLVVVPVLLALIIASSISPLVRLLQRAHIPRIWATWISLLAVVAVLGAIVYFVTRAVENQIDDLVTRASRGLSQLQDFASGVGITITAKQIDDARQAAIDFVTSAQFGTGALAGVAAAGNFFTALFLFIVVLFFFLKDGPRIWAFLLRPFTGEQFERADRAGHRVVSVLGGYVRGTAIIAAVDAIGIGVPVAIIGVPLALPLAVIVFITAFIPVVGATIAGVLAALVALVANGPVAAISVIIVVVLVNQLEGNLLQPFVQGRSLQLHPLVILLALTIGTVLGGILGAIIAVPIAASAWGVVKVWNGPNTPARFIQQKRPEPR